MLIHNKDDIEFVTEFPCFLGHPVPDLGFFFVGLLELLASVSDLCNTKGSRGLGEFSLTASGWINGLSSSGLELILTTSERLSFKVKLSKKKNLKSIKDQN